MLIPAVMFIESAVDGLKDIPLKVTEDQTSEVRCAMGQSTCDKLKISFPLSPDFVTGYTIGLQVARTILAGSVALALKGVDPKDVL
jgi:hypothetical protein